MHVVCWLSEACVHEGEHGRRLDALLLGKWARRAISFALVEVSEGDMLRSYASKRAYGVDTWCYASKLGVRITQGGFVHR